MQNKNQIGAVITGVGMYVPEKVLDNKYFESIVDTNDEWIQTRTGIKERRILENGATSDMATNAVKDLLHSTGTDPLDIDLIIVATITPDMFFPSTAALVQDNIGAKNSWGFDLSAACSGFLFGLETGANFIKSGLYKKVVVVGADKMSSIVDYTDRNTCILFGDGASAVLVEPTENIELGVKESILHLDGVGRNDLFMKAGGSLNPASIETVKNREHYIYQDGKAVFKVAVKGMADVSVEVMEKSGLSSEDVAYLVPHQANLRILDATAKRMGIPSEKVTINIQKYGNTTAATIPLCLTEYYRDGKIRKGDNLILAAFGGGYTWGAMHVVWSVD